MQSELPQTRAEIRNIIAEAAHLLRHAKSAAWRANLDVLEQDLEHHIRQLEAL